MSTSRDQTLDIKDFRGINRFNDGTVTPANEFFAIQNYHPVNRGELAAISGVVDQTAVAMPGVQEIVHTAWLDTSYGDKKLIAFFRPSMTSIPQTSATSANLSTSGGTGVNYEIMITYVGPGGATSFKIISAFSVQLSGFVFTPPNDVPSYVAAIDIHARISSGTANSSYLWCGTMSRRAGVFAASITCLIPVPAVTSATAVESVPNSFSFTPDATTGSLVSGRQFYCAIAPWVGQPTWRQSTGGRNTRAYNAYSGSQANGFYFTLPTSYTSAKLKFGFSATPALAAGTNVTFWVLFIGPTPEDMQAVCSATDGTITPIADAIIRAGVTVSELPYNARNTVHMVSSANMDQGLTGADAAAARDFGIFKNMLVCVGSPGDFLDGGGDILASTSFVGNLPYLGAWVIPALPFSLSTAYQLLPHINEKGFTKTNAYAPFAAEKTIQPAPMIFWDPATGINSEIHSKQYGNRLFVANNENVMFYTNGYSMKTIVRDSGVNYIPICQYIGLCQDQIVLGGGGDSYANTTGYVFYSNVGNPFAFGTTSPNWNNFPVSSGDGSKINGFGLFSQDLSTVGSRTFLLISKGGGSNGNLFSWNGQTGSNLVVSQIEKIGFAGPRAFAQTRFGAVMIARSGAYMVTGSTAVSPIGDEVQDILQGLSDTALNKINCTYHQNKVKIGYTASSGLDRELWLELRHEPDGIQKFWSGPHQLQTFTDQATTGFFNSSPDYRVCAFGAKLYRRDSGETNVGSAIARSITINSLAFNAEHFRKLINWIYMSVKIEQDETFNFTLTEENGTPSTSFSVTGSFANGARQFLQSKLTTRVTGRNGTLTITNTSSKLNSIYDIAFIFKPQRRRLVQ